MKREEIKEYAEGSIRLLEDHSISVPGFKIWMEKVKDYDLMELVPFLGGDDVEWYEITASRKRLETDKEAFERGRPTAEIERLERILKVERDQLEMAKNMSWPEFKEWRKKLS